MDRTLTLYQVDAFTHSVFGGNSAAVVPLTDWLDDAHMQRIAMENNLSETVFFVPTKDSKQAEAPNGETAQFHIRWFTPKVEVDLCGHATLAAAHVIFTYLHPQLTQVQFDSLSGPLSVSREGERLTMDFPNRMPTALDDADLLAAVEDALGAKVKSLHQARDVLVVLHDEQTVRTLTPDFAKLARLEKFGFCVTALGDSPEVDFVSRFFAPNQGINEDPVTGSAHCTSAPYWAAQLQTNTLTAVQVSERVGHLRCDVTPQRVLISGQCVTYLIGQMYC